VLAAVFEARTGWNLGELGPIFLIFALFFFGLVLWHMMKMLTGGKPWAMALTWILFYFAVSHFFATIYMDSGGMTRQIIGWMLAIGKIGLVFAFFILIKSLALKGSERGSWDRPVELGGRLFDWGAEKARERNEANKKKRIMKKGGKAIERLNRISEKLNADEGRLTRELETIEEAELNDLVKLSELAKRLRKLQREWKGVRRIYEKLVRDAQAYHGGNLPPELVTQINGDRGKIEQLQTMMRETLALIGNKYDALELLLRQATTDTSTLVQGARRERGAQGGVDRIDAREQGENRKSYAQAFNHYKNSKDPVKKRQWMRHMNEEAQELKYGGMIHKFAQHALKDIAEEQRILRLKQHLQANQHSIANQFKQTLAAFRANPDDDRLTDQMIVELEQMMKLVRQDRTLDDRLMELDRDETKAEAEEIRTEQAEENLTEVEAKEIEHESTTPNHHTHEGNIGGKGRFGFKKVNFE
jgi:hypothetical protein